MVNGGPSQPRSIEQQQTARHHISQFSRLLQISQFAYDHRLHLLFRQIVFEHDLLERVDEKFAPAFFDIRPLQRGGIAMFLPLGRQSKRGGAPQRGGFGIGSSGRGAAASGCCTSWSAAPDCADMKASAAAPRMFIIPPL